MVQQTICKMKLALMWIGGIVLFLVGMVGYLIGDTLIKQEISKRVVLEQGSDTYDEWKTPDIPISLEVYVFNITNMDEVVNGGKPYLEQSGPYVYTEHREKYDLAHHDNGTVTYKQRVTYHFDFNSSIGDDSHIITSVNIPLITLVEASRYNGTALKILENWLAKYYKEEFYIIRSVREVVWGYNDALLQWAHDHLNPKQYYTAISGVLINKNNTYDGTYTIHTGADDIKKVGQIDRFNGSKMLPYWTSDLANMINGSDGTIFRPFVSKKDIVRMFLSDICRSVYVLYHSGAKGPYDIPLYRFRATKESFEDKEENPYNAGFCTPADNCMGSGVLNVSVCQHVDGYPIPAVVSSPHFLYADKKYLDAVQNLHPNEDEHSTNLDIEPNTGLAMNINKRVQINIHVAPLSNIGAVAKIKEMVVPLLWVNETARIDDAHAHMVKYDLLIPQLAVNIIVYCLGALGGLILLLAVTLTIVVYMEPAKSEDPEKDEEEEEEDEEYEHIDVNCNSSSADPPLAASLTAAEIHTGSDTQHGEGDGTASSQGNSHTDAAIGHPAPGQDNDAFDDDQDTSDKTPLVGSHGTSEEPINQRSPSVNSSDPAAVVFSEDGPESDSDKKPIL